MITRLFLVISIAFILQPTNAFKILVYNPEFCHSHSNFLGQIADVLVDCGTRCGMYTSNTEQNVFEMGIFDPITPLFLAKLMKSIIGRTCVRLLEEPGLIDRLREEKYDVFIAENFEVCGMGISEAIRPKAVIGAASTCLYGFQFEEFGVPQALSHRPTLFHSSLDVHSFFSRLKNLIGELFIRIQFILSRIACDRALKQRFGPDYPSVAASLLSLLQEFAIQCRRLPHFPHSLVHLTGESSQSSRVAYLLTNSEPLLESAAPTLSRVIDIAQIAAKPPKPLDEHWAEIVARRPRTILLSLGSMVNSYLLPEVTKEGILKTIARFPSTTFIWKYERPEDAFSREKAARVANLVLSQWMPQADLLNDERVVAFITHGGMGSAQETAASGVPGIFIPIFGDQPRNAGMMAYNGLGVVFDKFDLHDDEKLADAIRKVTGNPKYREKASLVSRMPRNHTCPALTAEKFWDNTYGNCTYSIPTYRI